MKTLDILLDRLDELREVIDGFMGRISGTHSEIAISDEDYDIASKDMVDLKDTIRTMQDIIQALKDGKQ